MAKVLLGIALVDTKRTTDDKPFHTGFQPVYKHDDGKVTWRRPRVYRRGGKGVEYQVKMETLIKVTPDQTDRIVYA